MGYLKFSRKIEMEVGMSIRITTMLAVLLSWGVFFQSVDAVAQSISAKDSQMNITKIKITVGGESATANIYDNPAARDFLRQMPMTLTLKDYNNTEKISDLPQKLSTKEAPDGITPSRGDITYYAPWGNLAIFYKGFNYSRGLIILGKVESNLKILEQDGPFKATFEIVK